MSEYTEQLLTDRRANLAKIAELERALTYIKCKLTDYPSATVRRVCIAAANAALESKENDNY